MKSPGVSPVLLDHLPTPPDPGLFADNPRTNEAWYRGFLHGNQVGNLLVSSILAEAALEANNRARTDALTGLLNRNGLAEVINFLGPDVRHYGVANFDVDDFKIINDTYGHQKGDEVLQGVAEVLVASVRPGDYVIRLGGDEFLILADTRPRPDDIKAHGKKHLKPMDRMIELSDRVADNVHKKIVEQTDDKVLGIRLSCGLAVWEKDTLSVKQVFDAADKAMYVSKRARKAKPSQRPVRRRFLNPRTNRAS